VLRGFDPDQAVLWCQYPVKTGNVQAVVENDEAFRTRLKQKNLSYFVQGSILSPLLFDLFLNALLRLLDATGVTHGSKRTPQWNHAAFADDLSIYVCTVKDANKILDVIHEFESWSGLRISIPKSLDTGAMYKTGTARRQVGAKVEAKKGKRDAGPDILTPQIQALEGMDDALDKDNTSKLITKGQEAWRFNLVTMHR